MTRSPSHWPPLPALLLAFATACGAAPPASKPPAPLATAPSIASPPSAPGAPAPGNAIGDQDSPIPVTPSDPVWGARDALVTIVEFSDFQCPFCSRAEHTLDKVRAAYGPDKVRIVWKNEPLPFHPNARPAAEAARGVFVLRGNDAFWKFHDLAFDNQADLGEDKYVEWANAAGVTDAAKLRAGLADHRWGDKIDTDHALAQRLGVNGTPAFFINGRILSGAQPLEKFKAMIDEQLAAATQLLEKGTARDKLYVVASTANFQAPSAANDDDGGGEKEDTTTVFRVPVGQSPQRGPATAPVTIVLFSDFQCPYCKRVEATLTELRHKYEGKVRIVWKDEPLPFHPRAEPAAELAREARAQKGDAGFWAVHDRLFESQPKLEDDDLAGIAKAAGLDVAKARAAIASKKYARQIEADQELADDVQASGTPHFFINGRRLVGAQPLEKFIPIIDDELKHAEALRARGVAPAKLYDEMIKDGKGAPPLQKVTVAPAPNAPFRGAANAVVTIEEFSDFQCPFCNRVEATLAELLKAYPGKVKLVWRNLPLPMHHDAPLAARAAMEAYAQKGNAGFWKMHDLLFESQRTTDGLKRPALDEYARQLGLDMKRWATALDGDVHAPAIAADAKAAENAAISGTPTFTINGYLVTGAQPLSKFRKAVDLALSEAAKR